MRDTPHGESTRGRGAARRARRSTRAPPVMGARPSRYEPRGFGGRNRFWLRGRCVTGPDYRGTALTLLLIVVLALLACGVTFRFLIAVRPIIGVSLLVITLVSAAIALWACWLAATTDPGIIPRSTAPPPPARRDRTLTVRGRTILVKFCETCRIWRPPRASHCGTCNNCVQRFDHHCPWLGNDIGVRNYRSYFTFVSSSTVAAVAVIIAAVWHIIAKVDYVRTMDRARRLTTAQAIRKALSSGATAANLPLILICLLAVAFTGGLTVFHIYLMCNNVTTAESFKKAQRNSATDEDDLRGCAAMYFLQCTQRPTSAISQGFADIPYPDHELIAKLIAEQIEEERIAQLSTQGPRRSTDVDTEDGDLPVAAPPSVAMNGGNTQEDIASAHIP